MADTLKLPVGVDSFEKKRMPYCLKGCILLKNKSLCEALLSTNDFYDPRDFGFTDHEVKKNTG